MNYLNAMNYQSIYGGADELPFCEGQSWGTYIRETLITMWTDLGKNIGKSQFGM